jgi:hypothetical protein
MPLDGYNEMRGAIQLNSFNHVVFRGDCADEEVVSYSVDGLVMTRVDLNFQPVAGREQSGKPRFGVDAHRMGIENGAARAVIDRCSEVLNQTAIEPDIETLQTRADGEDGLVQIEGVLQQELVDGCAGGIGWAAFGYTGFAISLRVNIVATTGKQDALNTEKDAGHAGLALMERHKNGRHSGGMKGGQIRRERALIVGGIGAGGLGYSDMDGHGSTQCMPVCGSGEGDI